MVDRKPEKKPSRRKYDGKVPDFDLDKWLDMDDAEDEFEEDLATWALSPNTGFATIRTALNRDVVGQAGGKEGLAMLLSLHLNNVAHPERNQRIPNAVLVGPTGVGKTYSISTIARDFALPVVTVDCTSLVPAGVQGLQLEQVAEQLFNAARELLVSNNWRSSNSDVVALAQRGIVFLDEFDKIATPQDSENQSDASRRQVQRRLLKLAEGTSIRVGLDWGRGPARGEYLDTREMLFIAGGAFADIKQRTAGQRANNALYVKMFGPQAIVAEDLRNYGFLQELVARFPLVINYYPLSERDLLDILGTADNSPLQLWQTYAADHGIRLDMTGKAMAVVARRAREINLGARGLHQLLFPFLASRLTRAFENQQQELHIDADDLDLA